MVFSSILFLWIFLPVCLVGNLIIQIIKFKNPKTKIKIKNIFLLIMSFVFYAWGGIGYLAIMIFSILLNFWGSYFIDKAKEKTKLKKFLLVLVIILNLGMLFIFKYFNMLLSTIECISNPDWGFKETLINIIKLESTGSLMIEKVILPIGISFFTFQSMSYTIDVYRSKVKVTYNILNFALYVSFFPQLVAGPIVKYTEIEKELENRDESWENFNEGKKKFCYGLAKKVILANTFATVVDSIWKLDVKTIGAPIACLGAISYALQIYYDFSGYSDMAIGLGKMFGFNFNENFNYPYTSTSIKDFWRRWHISLSTWFKEYVYIPLGGNRKGKGRTLLNLFLVFLITGIWHGANFTFILWGIWFAILQIIERLGFGKLLEKNPVKLLNWLYVSLAVLLGWVFFRSDNIFQACDFITQMFMFKVSETESIFTYLSFQFIICFIFGILLCGFVQRPLIKIYKEKFKNKTAVEVIDNILQFGLLAFAILMLVGDTYNPFIYFQF